MKSYTLLAAAIMALVITTGAAAGGNKDSGGGNVDRLSLEEAVERSASAVAENLPARTRVAIVAFEAEHENLAGYIMDELTGALVDGRLEVADRNNLPYVLKELNFQMSGMVDDDSASRIGKFLGARYVITGQLVPTGETYRYRLAVINVESAVQEVSGRYTVQNDRATKKLVATLQNNKQVTRAAKYAVTEETTPQTAGTFLDRGIMFANQGNYEMAIADFTQAIKLDPNNAAAYCNRGVVYDDYDRAIADFNHAIKLDPNYATAYYNRGVAYYNVGDYDGAIAEFNQVIKLDPNNANTYNNRGITYYNKGEYDHAIADYTEAIELDPNFVDAYYNRGITYEKKDDYNRALTDYTQAIKLNPNYTAAYNSRGFVYVGTGAYDRAIADFNQAIKLDPNYVDAYSNRGLVYGLIGDYDRAIADVNAAFRISPNNAFAKYALELIRKRQGRL